MMRFTLAIVVTLLSVPSDGFAISYLQPGRYYVTPANPVRWLEANRSTLLVSDHRSVVAGIDRANGTLRWTHNPSGGRIDTLTLSDDGLSVVVSGVDLEVLDPATGAMRWAMRLQCRSPCENRVQAVVKNAVLVSGGGPVHRWLWRYDLATGRMSWPAPIAIGHPRVFVADGPSEAFLLEANAPFSVRRMDLSRARTLSRHPWRSGAIQIAGSELFTVGDGRAALVGPYPGGGMPPVAVIGRGARWVPQAVRLSGGELAGRRVSRVISHGRLIAALGRERGGMSHVVIWNVDAPTRPVWRSPEVRHAALTPLRVGQRRYLVAVLNSDLSARVLSFDATSVRQNGDLVLPCSRRCRAMDAGQGKVVVIENHHQQGAMALIDAADNTIESVGTMDRTHVANVARAAFGGTLVGTGSGIATALQVPLKRAQADLASAKSEGELGESQALERALLWATPSRGSTLSSDASTEPTPRPSTREPKASASMDGRTLARTIRQSPPLLRLERLGTAFHRLSNAGFETMQTALNALVTVTAEVVLKVPSPHSPPSLEPWKALMASLGRLVDTHGKPTLSQAGRRYEPAMRALVVLTAVGAILRRDESSALSVLQRWLALPSVREPGIEFITEVAARAVLVGLFTEHVGGLRSNDDAVRHAAARGLASFPAASMTLGSERWLTERTRPVLEGTRPESRRAARALAEELRSVTQRFQRERGSGGVGGPGCALVCRVLRDGCDMDCHSDCERRYRRCINTCKRRRLPKVSLRDNGCR